MSNSNLGLNRKVIKVLVDSLSDSDSKIYKDIMSITGEPSGEVDENDTLINYLTDGTEVTTLTSNAVKKVADDVFNGYNKLVTVNFPKATSIGDSAFESCTSLTSIDLPNVTSIGDGAFYSCSNLTSIDLPNVTSIGVGVFYNCTSLTSIDLPNVTSIGTDVFKNCTSLTSIDLPNVTSIGNSAFYSCTSLTSIDLPNVTSIGSYVFNSCNNLSTVIMSTNQIITLEDKSVFNDTPISNKTGYIYVPDSLVDSYKTATNWSTYALQIKPISELPQEYKTLYNIT